MKFRIAAENELGRGEFSEINIDGVKMVKRPSTIKGLKLVAKTPNSVEFSWDPVQNDVKPGVIYYIQRKKDDEEKWTRLRKPVF